VALTLYRPSARRASPKLEAEASGPSPGTTADG
jgi:hypothetical protein